MALAANVTSAPPTINKINEVKLNDSDEKSQTLKHSKLKLSMTISL